jgi:hypothetical protein
MRGPRITIAIWLLLGALTSGGLFLMEACGGAANPASSSSSDPSTQDVTTYPAPEVALGERLFVETRFAQFFATHMTGINQPLSAGDPVVAVVQTTSGTLPGPYAGQSINCRSCHFVTEFEGGAGNRSYSDFTTRSPLPRTINGFDHTPRNAEQMVESLMTRSGPTFLHGDGEFVDPIDLVQSTLTGRNFGWSPDERSQAIAFIAQVIRQDDGTGKLAAERSGGLSYSTLLLGTSSTISPQFLIPPAYRLNVQTATDQQVLTAVAKLIQAYMAALLFQQNSAGVYFGTPYDVFLQLNELPRQPNPGESFAAYNQRLLQSVQALTHPNFVTKLNGSFKYHSQPFQFGTTELAGLKIFLSSAPGATDGSQHAGNCASCHAAPNFTDFVFHCTGVAQEEYDAANGT